MALHEGDSMSIVITPTPRGYRYTCDCDNPDILVENDEDYLCLSCDSWRTVASCRAEAKELKAEVLRQDILWSKRGTICKHGEVVKDGCIKCSASSPTICDCDYCTQYGGSSIIHRPNCTHTFIHDIADLSLPRCSCPEDNAYGEDMSIPYEVSV